jgi:small basic protein (TIGR04137 family)
MSIHSSLRGSDTLVGERSVFTRAERLQILIKQGKLNPEKGDIFRLPKVRTRFKVAGAKKAKAEKPAADAAGGAGAVAAAPTPAPAPEPTKGKGKGKDAGDRKK